MKKSDVIVVDCIDQLIRKQAADRPDRTGLIFEGKSFTYSELNSLSNKAGNAFLKLGIKPGDRIVWLAQNLPQFWFALFGAAKIGAVLTPVNWRLAPREVAQIVSDAGAVLLVSEQQFLDDLNTVEGFKAPPVLKLETGSDDGFEALVEAQNDSEPDYTSSLEDIVVQLYTSGTTGLPKGVILPNRCYAASGVVGAEMELVFPQSDDEVALHALPHFHVAGVNFGLMAVARSMPILQHRGFDPAALVEAAKGDVPLNSFFVPAMIMMILQAAQQQGVSLEKFSNISYGAAPMPEPLLDAAMAAMPNARFTQFYGATETTGGLTTLSHEDHAKGKPQRVSAGKPYPDGKVRIVDPATGKDVAQGETGEVYTKSPYLMDGYWKRQDATDEVLKDGWYQTGDAGYADENGFIYIVDRIKDMIISGGENIYPAELEGLLEKHPCIAEVAVIGVPDEKWGEIVKVCAVKKAGSELDEDGVIECLSGEIAKFKMPRHVEFISALPRNPSGKVLKTELRKSHRA